MDGTQERSCKWGKWKPTVFNGAPMKDPSPARLGRTRSRASIPAISPCTARGPWAQAQSPSLKRTPPRARPISCAGWQRAGHFCPLLVLPHDEAEKQCMLTVTQTPDQPAVVKSRSTSATSRMPQPRSTTRRGSAELRGRAEEHSLHRCGGRGKVGALEEEKRKAKEAKAKKCRRWPCAISGGCWPRRRRPGSTSRRWPPFLLETVKIRSRRSCRGSAATEAARVAAEKAAATKVKETAEEAASREEEVTSAARRRSGCESQGCGKGTSCREREKLPRSRRCLRRKPNVRRSGSSTP